MNRRKTTLLAVTTVAVALHLLLIFAIQHMPLPVPTKGGGLGRMLSSKFVEPTPADREEDLATLFEELLREPAPEPTPFDSLADEFVAFSDGEEELDATISERRDLLTSVDEPLQNDSLNWDRPEDDTAMDAGRAAQMLDLTSHVADGLDHWEVVRKYDERMNSEAEGDAFTDQEMQASLDGAAAGNHIAGASQGVIATSQDFTIDTKVAKDPKGGYQFSVTLKPKEGVRFRRINQNIFYLIDRSYSISSARFDRTKEAVSKALDHLKSGDTFNILFFDSRIIRLAPTNLARTDKNIRRAREFLDSTESGGMFSSTDLYSSLGKIVPESVADHEVNTAILLSDGHTLLKLDKQRRAVGEWTEANRGKVSLFAVSDVKADNRALLDAITTLNKGEVASGELESALLSVLARIGNPVGKELHASTVTENTSTLVQLIPAVNQLPDLYAEKPYTLYGRVNELKPFHLFLQGRYYDRYLDIKQKVDLQDSPSARDLREMVARHEAFDHYRSYLQSGKKGELVEANRLLKPFNRATAF